MTAETATPERREQLQPLISCRRIGARVAALARAIDEQYRGQELSLLVVLKSAFVFAADLARRMTIPFTIDFVAASSYGAATRSSGAVALDGIERLELVGRHVLVVEDILDSGLTSAAILAALRRREPAGIAFCALLRKPTAAGLDLPVTHVGFEIGQDFVVGYGMDYAERYRSLPDIHRLLFA